MKPAPKKYRLLLWPVLLGTTLILLGCAQEKSPPAKDSSSPKTESRSRPMFHQDLQEGLKKAHQFDKPVLLLFTDPNCVYSRQMLESTFQNQEVQALANRFVCVQIDSCEATPLCDQFQVEAFPTIQFLTSSGVPLQRLKGNQMPSRLSEEMRLALQRIAMKQSIYGNFH